ncbi:hypothetical protein ACTD5D_38370 [Nocardia takedensis]|uniref:hypothetical protein n=1 Tax=Nocardia takedensis TaxID=259390 RepID=UPI003F77637B
MTDSGQLMPDLHARLAQEYGTVGRFLFDAGSGVLTALSRAGTGLALILSSVGEGVRIDLGLGVSLVVPHDGDVLDTVRTLLDSGIRLAVPPHPTDTPVIRYTLDSLHNTDPDTDYIEFTIPGW